MRSRISGSLGIVATIAGTTIVVGLGSLFVTPTAGQSSAAAALPRLQGTTNPNLNGIWQAFTTANWDILDHSAQPAPFPNLLGAWGAQPGGAGIVEGNVIPYRPEALARKKANFDKRLVADPQNLHGVGDPEAKCYMLGVPRSMYAPFPFQIIQTPTRILMAFEFASAARTIHLKDHQEAPVEFWMGWSNGRWEGDTLVVDVTGQNGFAWFDRAGNFASENLHVVERYTPVSQNHLIYEATIEDPTVFTRSWKMSFPLYRRLEKNVELAEFKCAELAEEYVYGSLRKKPAGGRP